MAPARTIVIGKKNITNILFLKNNIIIHFKGGGSGFVGKHLCKLLREVGYNVSIISRMPGPNRMTWHDLIKCGLPENTKAVVNLAGQNILDFKQRWTSGFKQNVWNSRINTTCLLANAIKKAECLPESFIVMTGVGIYPPSPDPCKVYNELSILNSNDYITDLCHHWEKASLLTKNENVRRVIIRSGVVLGRYGGMIQNMFVPFYLGLGGPLGSGCQVLPWIHIEDACRLIIFAIENERVEGILNGVSPHIITNAEFTYVSYFNPFFF